MTLTFTMKTKQGWIVKSPLEPFTFPGGEAHVKGTEHTEAILGAQYHIADLRGADSHELFQLAAWADALDNIYGGTSRYVDQKRVLLLPYLPAARADKAPTTTSLVYTSFLTDVVIPDQIVSLDPHSPFMPSYLSGVFTEFPFERILRRAVGRPDSDEHQHPYVGVIAPDKGATERAQRAADVLHVPVYHAGKTRDFTTGALTGFHMEDELPAEGRFLLVDDICDGGGTFNGLADAIGIGLDRLDLWVTHGIFSKGVEELQKRFGNIYTTDSHPNAHSLPNLPHLHVIPALPYLIEAINV